MNFNQRTVPRNIHVFRAPTGKRECLKIIKYPSQETRRTLAKTNTRRIYKNKN